MHIASNPARRLFAIYATLFPIMSAAFLIGCASSIRSQYADVEALIGERTGQHIVWNATPPTAAENEQGVAMFFKSPLTASTVSYIALVNNRSLQGSLQEIGISRADLVQAGLLHNPEIFMRYRWQYVGPDASNFEFRLTRDFIDLATMHLRRKIAKQEMELAKAQVADAALKLIHEAEVAFYTLQAQMQTRDQQRMLIGEMDSIAKECRGRCPGSEHSILGKEIAVNRARQALAEMDLQIVADREQLNRLMGLSGAQAGAWSVAAEAPQLPAAEPSQPDLETLAIEHRMDLAAARMQTATLNEAMRLQQITRWVPFLYIGVDYERNTNMTKVAGPTVQFMLPIFDWGQARMARSRALIEQSRQRAASLETDIRSQVREANQRLLAERSTVQYYRDGLLPQTHKMVALAQDNAASAESSDAELLKDKQDEAAAQIEYINALRDYWIARTKLGAALGGSIGCEKP